MPLTVAMHCSKLTKPQLRPPSPPRPPYCAHQGYSTAWAGGGANALAAANAAIASRVFRIVSSLVMEPQPASADRVQRQSNKTLAQGMARARVLRRCQAGKRVSLKGRTLGRGPALTCR